ncbi:MAG TPA: recombinase A [Spirochaetia bacterium]|nr:recombinase A [Spirochaetia bacterium]
MAASGSVPSGLVGIPVFPAAHLKSAAHGGSWGFDNLVGILAEISEETPAGAVSIAAEIIAQAQTRGEPVAWIAGTESIFFPPDLLDRGIDLRAISVIRAGAEPESLTAAEWLIRSGAFGLVVLDLDGEGNVSDASLGRILKVAKRTQCAVLFLTRKHAGAPSLGSQISLRGCVTRCGAEPILVHLDTVKDKRSSFSPRYSRQYHGPSGMH